MKTVLSAIAFLLSIATSALAADISTKAPRVQAYVAEGPLSWQGLYLGTNLGYGQKDQDLSISGNDKFSKSILSSNLFPSTIPLNPKGFLVSFEGGYDHRIADRLYLRILGGYTYSGMEANAYTGGNLSGWQFRERIQNIWDVLGGIGWTPGSGRTMISVIGGWTGATVETSVTSSGILNAFGVSGPSGSSSDFKSGWSIGGEVEHRISQNWSAKIRYLYTDLGGQDTTAVASTSCGKGKTCTTSWNNHQDVEMHRVLFGVNYRF